MDKKELIENLGLRVQLWDEFSQAERQRNKIKAEYNNLPQDNTLTWGFDKFTLWKGVAVFFIVGLATSNLVEWIIDVTRPQGHSVRTWSFFLEMLSWPLFIIISIVICVAWKRMNKKKIEDVEQANLQLAQQRAAISQDIEKRVTSANEEIEKARQRYQRVANQFDLRAYQRDYEAIKYFHRVLYNGLVDDLKGAKLMWEQEEQHRAVISKQQEAINKQNEHNQKMQKGQREMIKQQKLGNLIGGVSAAANVSTALSSSKTAQNTSDILDHHNVARREAGMNDYEFDQKRGRK